jgi:hypothetical protein
MELCIAFSVEFFRFSVPEKEYPNIIIIAIQTNSISHINGNGEFFWRNGIWSRDVQIAKKLCVSNLE